MSRSVKVSSVKYFVGYHPCREELLRRNWSNNWTDTARIVLATTMIGLATAMIVPARARSGLATAGLARLRLILKTNNTSTTSKITIFKIIVLVDTDGRC